MPKVTVSKDPAAEQLPVPFRGKSAELPLFLQTLFFTTKNWYNTVQYLSMYNGQTVNSKHSKKYLFPTS
jgi:hypothetical protein